MRSNSSIDTRQEVCDLTSSPKWDQSPRTIGMTKSVGSIDTKGSTRPGREFGDQNMDPTELARQGPPLTLFATKKSGTNLCYSTVSGYEFTRVNSGSLVYYHAVMLLYFGHRGDRSDEPSLDRILFASYCYMMKRDLDESDVTMRCTTRRVLRLQEGEEFAKYLN